MNAFQWPKIKHSCQPRRLGIEKYSIFSEHDLTFKITCLSISPKIPYDIFIDLNDFLYLETFYGKNCEIVVDHDHSSLENLYLERVTFSTLPIKLIKLAASYECCIKIRADHPKLPALRVLAIEFIEEPVYCTSILRVHWNENLEFFSYYNRNETNMDEIFSMIGPRVESFEFFRRFSSMIPTLLRSLSFVEGTKCNLTAFTHMTSLTLDLPIGEIDSLKYPPNLLKLLIADAKFKDLANVEFPPN